MVDSQLPEIPHVVLPLQYEARQVLAMMRKIIANWGSVTVQDLKDLCGIEESAYSDTQWGWIELPDITIERVEKGYLLSLPIPILLIAPKGPTVQKIVSKVGNHEIVLGNPDELVRHGGDWTSAIGRLFQGSKDGMTITIKHPKGLIEDFFLKEVE